MAEHKVEGERLRVEVVHRLYGEWANPGHDYDDGEEDIESWISFIGEQKAEAATEALDKWLRPEQPIQWVDPTRHSSGCWTCYENDRCYHYDQEELFNDKRREAGLPPFKSESSS